MTGNSPEAGDGKSGEPGLPPPPRGSPLCPRAAPARSAPTVAAAAVLLQRPHLLRAPEGSEHRCGAGKSRGWAGLPAHLPAHRPTRLRLLRDGTGLARCRGRRASPAPSSGRTPLAPLPLQEAERVVRWGGSSAAGYGVHTEWLVCAAKLWTSYMHGVWWNMKVIMRHCLGIWFEIV